MADINLKITIDDNSLANAVKKAMNADPSFVHITRCKHCKEWTLQEEDRNSDLSLGYCSFFSYRTFADDFCSYGGSDE